MPEECGKELAERGIQSLRDSRWRRERSRTRDLWPSGRWWTCLDVRGRRDLGIRTLRDPRSHRDAIRMRGRWPSGRWWTCSDVRGHRDLLIRTLRDPRSHRDAFRMRGRWPTGRWWTCSDVCEHRDLWIRTRGSDSFDQQLADCSEIRVPANIPTSPDLPPDLPLATKSVTRERLCELLNLAESVVCLHVEFRRRVGRNSGCLKMFEVGYRFNSPLQICMDKICLGRGGPQIVLPQFITRRPDAMA